MKSLKVRNKNAILELLDAGADFQNISIVNNLDQDKKTKEILARAKERGIKITTKPIKKMAKGRSGKTREAIIGFLVPTNLYSLEELLGKLYEKKKIPFFLLVNRIKFENNIGLIARTALAAGVNGIIFQGNDQNILNDETMHLSMGAIARIPMIKMDIFSAIKQLQKEGIPTYCLHMNGTPYYQKNLSGPVAFVLGGEGEGISSNVLEKCDGAISIPMQQGIDSINVSTSAGIVLYEKVRQEKQK